MDRWRTPPAGQEFLSPMIKNPVHSYRIVPKSLSQVHWQAIDRPWHTTVATKAEKVRQKCKTARPLQSTLVNDSTSTLSAAG